MTAKHSLTTSHSIPPSKKCSICKVVPRAQHIDNLWALSRSEARFCGENWSWSLRTVTPESRHKWICLIKPTHVGCAFLLLQDILRQSSVQVHIEVRPKYLIPDTNCFIDSCQSLIRIAESYPLFQLLVPLVGELSRAMPHTSGLQSQSVNLTPNSS